jgi:hypothetical protein
MTSESILQNHSLASWLDSGLDTTGFDEDKLFVRLEQAVKNYSVLDMDQAFIRRANDDCGDQRWTADWMKAFALFTCARIAANLKGASSYDLIRGDLLALERAECIVRVDNTSPSRRGEAKSLRRILSAYQWHIYTSEKGESDDNEAWNTVCPFADWAWDAIHQFAFGSSECVLGEQRCRVIQMEDSSDKTDYHFLKLELVLGVGDLAAFPDPRSMTFFSTEDKKSPQSFPLSLINAICAVRSLKLHSSLVNVKIRWNLTPTYGKYYDYTCIPPLQGNSLGGSFALMLAKLIATHCNKPNICVHLN